MFELECLRSERRRIAWIAITIVVGAGIGLVRLGFSGDSERGFPTAWLVVIALVMLLYESAGFLLVSRRIKEARPLPRVVWVINAIVEPQFITALLVILTASRAFGAFGGLTAPTILVYFIVVALAALRLSPMLCWIAAASASLGYGGAIALAYVLAGDSVAPYPLGVYLTVAGLIGLAGVASGAVASGIRAQVCATLDESNRRRADRESSRNNLIFALARLAEYRDSDTGDHLNRIAKYVEVLATALQDHVEHIDNDWTATLRVASSMHDIGKVGIPDVVLLKSGRLTDDERDVMRKHPSLGAETLAAIRARHGEDRLLEMSELIARQHHERWDGKGYPNGLKGETISLEARIVAVADVYDALTSKRVYKPAMSHSDATALIREGSSTQFDPVVVAAFESRKEEFDRIREASQETEDETLRRRG